MEMLRNLQTAVDSSTLLFVLFELVLAFMASRRGRTAFIGYPHCLRSQSSSLDYSWCVTTQGYGWPDVCRIIWFFWRHDSFDRAFTSKVRAWAGHAI